jgi:hypothetical protein
MNKIQLKPMALVFLFSLLALSFQAQKSVEFAYNVNSGNQYQTVLNIDQDIVFEANGQQMALDQLMTIKMEMKVNEVTGDSIKLENQFTSVKMTQGIFGMTVTYDSEDPSTMQNPMAAKVGEEMGKLINKSFFMAMDQKGNIGNMNLGNLTDNDDIANNMTSGAMFIAYPDGKVSVGESWEKEIFTSETSDMKFRAVYTLLKVSGKQATIKIDGTITANTVADADLRLNGTQKGEIIVDTKTGWFIESTIDQEIELDIEQNGMKYPATISGTIVTTSTAKN